MNDIEKALKNVYTAAEMVKAAQRELAEAKAELKYQDEKSGNMDVITGLVYFALNSEYQFWLPGCGMDKPEKLPKYCESWYDMRWVNVDNKNMIAWEQYIYRWPKISCNINQKKEKTS